MTKKRPRVSKKIFILGSGRSGTHWLGYVLAAHPKVIATIEKPGLFHDVTEAAIYEDKRPKLIKKIIRQYRIEHRAVLPDHYLDKSHPNIWLADDLAAAFNNAIFIGIIRNPFAVVASTLKHAGVRERLEKWESYPVPNRLLGITEENLEEYRQMSLPARAALRWAVHNQRFEELKVTLGDRLLVVHYEDLANKPKRVLKQLKEFINLEDPVPMPEIKKDSLNKWKDSLSKEDLADIDEVLEKYGRFGY